MNLFKIKSIRLKTFILLILLLYISAAKVSYAEPSISTPSAILIDSYTGQVMWSKNASEKRSIASTTKIMTAILVIEKLSLNDVAITSKRASEVGESEIYLVPGEKLTVQQLLYASMLRSANDAVMTLAEKTAGSAENFVKMMNEKAKELGMKSTSFANPHGLTNGSHKSSAKDLAVLSRYAMKNPVFRKIVSTKKIIIPWPGRQYKRLIESHNRLIGKYKYAIGIKTGFTNDSQHCLASAAKKGNREVIAVLLGGRSGEIVANESQQLLEYGLSNFKAEIVIKKGHAYGKYKPLKDIEAINLESNSNLSLLIPKKNNSNDRISFYTAPEKSIELPIRKGQVLGSVKAYANGEILGETELVSDKSISKPIKIGSSENVISKIINYIVNIFR